MPRNKLIGLAAGLSLAAVLGATTGGFVLLSGAYDTAATRQHFAFTHRLLEIGLRMSVRRSAAHIEPPDDQPLAALKNGAACYREHCVACHGAPGVAPDAYALGMLPVPTSLVQASRDWTQRELFWIVSKGVRMTGMPAWEYRLSADSRWATVAFLQSLPRLTAPGWKQLAAYTATTRCARSVTAADVIVDPDVAPDSGASYLRQYGCMACHRIEGLVGAPVDVGPPLSDWPRRHYIAGVIPNTPANLVRWIQAPEAVSPGSLMPDLGVPREHAERMAAFLFRKESSDEF
jgi:mono/diheme cytochrome c family protein